MMRLTADYTSLLYMVPRDSGNFVTIPMKIIIEDPLPIPRSVICSLIQEMSADPEVKEIVARIMNLNLETITTPGCAKMSC